MVGHEFPSSRSWTAVGSVLLFALSELTKDKARRRRSDSSTGPNELPVETNVSE